MALPASLLVAQCHGDVLRSFSRHADRHFTGVQAVGHFFRRTLSARSRRRAVQLEICFNVLRHVTEAACANLLSDISAELGPLGVAAGAGGEEQQVGRVSEERESSKAEGDDTKALGAAARVEETRTRRGGTSSAPRATTPGTTSALGAAARVQATRTRRGGSCTTPRATTPGTH